MVADIFTKPLQGNAFYKFCNAILNVQSTNHDPDVNVTVMGSQECVEERAESQLSSLTCVGKDIRMSKDLGGVEQAAAE
jgi:hypothetical protein